MNNTFPFGTDMYPTDVTQEYWHPLWYIWAIIWLCPVTVLFTCLTYILHVKYIDYRFKKHKAIGTGIVLDTFSRESGGEYNTTTYYIKYKFEDRRSEITVKYMKQVFDKFLSDQSRVDGVPSDILDILTEYIGHNGEAFVFWYGPFEKKQESVGELPGRFENNQRIQVEYNLKNPQHCHVLSNESEPDWLIVILCGIVWLIVILCNIAIFIGVVFGLIATFNDMDAHGEQIDFLYLMSLLFVMSAGIAFVFWQYCSSLDKTFLFEDNMGMDRYMNCEKTYELVVDDEQKKYELVVDDEQKKYELVVDDMKVRRSMRIQNKHQNYKEIPRWRPPPGYWNLD